MTGEPNWKEIEEFLRRNLPVNELKRNPEATRERERQRDETVRWTVSELMKGPILGGTAQDIDSQGWMFGSYYWESVKRAVILRDPVCRICGKRPTMEVHHIRPRFLNGKDHPRNLVGLCFECHDEVHRAIDRGIKEALEQSLNVKVPVALPLESFIERQEAEQ